MKKTIFSFLFASSVCSAAYLEDVKILNASPSQNGFQLKLKEKGSASNSFFFIEVVKSDPDSFEKLVHVIQKMKHKDAYRLDLDILSFSSSPSGSHYRSDDIQFSSPTGQTAANANTKNTSLPTKRSAASDKKKNNK